MNLTQHGWRSCTLELDMKTLHQEARLVWVLSDHVNDPLYLNALEKIIVWYRWCSWDTDTFEMCGCGVQQQPYGSIEVGQTDYVRAIQTIPITPPRRRRQQEVLCRHVYFQVSPSRGELGLLAQQTMIAQVLLAL